MLKTIDFEVIADNFPCPFAILYPVKDSEEKIIDYTFLFLNKNALCDLDLRTQEVPLKKLTEVFADGSLIQKCNKVLNDNIPDKMDLSFKNKTLRTSISVINNNVTLTWNEEIAVKNNFTETEEHYQALFNAIDEGFCIIEMLFNENNEPFDYRFVEINPAFEKQTGLHNVQDKTILEFAPNFEKHWFETYGDVVLTREPKRFQNHAEELERWFDVYAFPVGRPEEHKVAVIFKDITQQKNAEEALQIRASEMEGILNSIADGVFVYDRNGRIIHSNAAAMEIMNYQSSELKITLSERTPLFTVMAEDGRMLKPEEMAAYRATTFAETTRNAIFKIKGKGNSEEHWVTLSAAPIFISGKHTGAVVSMSDITAQKKAEEKLRINEAVMGAFFNASTGILNLFDQELRFVKCDKITPTYFGLDQETIIGKSVKDLNPEFADQFLFPIMQRVIDSGQPEMNKVVPGSIPSRNGETGYWLMSLFPVPISKEEMGLGVMGVEITDLIRAEKALKESEVKLLEAQKLARFGNYTVDLKNKGSMQWSDQMYEIWETDKSKPIPSFEEIWNLIHPEDRECVEQSIMGATKENNKIETEFRIVFPRNRIKYIYLITQGFFDESGKLIKREGVEIDITERKVNQLKLEEANRDIADRLKEKEVLLREIYHRTKNTLQLISSMLSLKAGMLPGNEFKNIIEDIQDRIRAIALVHEKLYKGDNLSRVNLQEYIISLANLLLYNHSTDGKITFRHDLEEMHLLIDSVIPCGLIITELIMNSVKHAFPGKMKGYIEIKLRKTEDDVIELSVADNGIGIKNNNQDREDKLGLQLFRTIAEDQLDADVSLNTDNGVVWIICFKDALYKERV